MATRALATAATGLRDGFTIAADDPAGVIQVTGIGFWSPAMVDAHFARLRRLVRERREQGGPIRTLVDLRGSGVQSSETVSRVGAGAMSTYQAGDRVAIIVVSNLAKMQMRRIIRSSEHEFFVSPDAARMWLTAS